MPRVAYRQGMASGTSALAELIVSARKALDWSQERLAEESGVGRRTIIRWETEANAEPLASQLRDVANALRIPAEDAFRAVGWLPARIDERRRVSLEDYTDGELIAELQRRMTATAPAEERGRKTA
jgi:transcriptional regulator with XRE-family HTH domain